MVYRTWPDFVFLKCLNVIKLPPASPGRLKFVGAAPAAAPAAQRTSGAMLMPTEILTSSTPEGAPDVQMLLYARPQMQIRCRSDA